MIYRNQLKNIAMFLIKTVIVMVNTVLFSTVWFLYYKGEMWGATYYRRGDYVLVILYLCLFSSMTKLYGGMELRTSRITELIYSQIVSIIITNSLMYLVILLLTRRPKSVLPLFLVMVVEVFACSVWAYVAIHLTNKIYKPASILLVYDNAVAYKNGKEIIDRLSWHFLLVGEVLLSGKNCMSDSGKAEINKFINQLNKTNADAVMLCGLASTQRNDIIKYCVENNIKAFVRPNIGDFIIGNAQVVQMANLPVFICERRTQGVVYTVVKRTLDIVISLVGLVITSPILIIAAICIKLYDHGPVFYKQIRLTKNGQEFNILKFRSMKVDAENDGVARLSTENDDRVTPIGKVMRAYRIDELPQLVNVLHGELSFVGPRPERPEIASQYVAQMPEFSLRLQVKAGLTGYAQVFGKYNTDPYDKLQMDLLYITRMSLVNDFKIMLATIKILFISESTEGIEEGHTTAGEYKKELK